MVDLNLPPDLDGGNPISIELFAHVRAGWIVAPDHALGQVRISYAADPDMCAALLHTEAALELALGLIAAINRISRGPVSE